MEERNTSSWQAAYGALTAFVAERETIRITPISLRIPKPEREAFYALVDGVVNQLVSDIAGERLRAAEDLAKQIEETRQRIYAGSNLKAWRLPASIENLIRTPEAAASQPIFDLVLDALQNGRGSEELEDRAAQLLLPHLKDLQRCTYEAWAYLGIIEAWHPVRFYGVVTTDFASLTVSETDEVTMGYQQSSPDKRIPETVFETADGRTVAVKTETGLEMDYYGEKVSREKGYSSGGNTVNELSHRVLLCYCLPNPQAVGFLADAEKAFVRPTDLTCSFLLPSEMENEYLYSSVIRHLNTVRSLRPVQILSFDQNGRFPEIENPGLALPRWERMVVGYDREQLKSIADKLFKNQKTEGGTHENQP